MAVHIDHKVVNFQNCVAITMAITTEIKAIRKVTNAIKLEKSKTVFSSLLRENRSIMLLKMTLDIMKCIAMGTIPIQSTPPKNPNIMSDIANKR